MSYRQYQEYGGNPYASGPNAEAGIGGAAYGSQQPHSYDNHGYGSQPNLGHELSATSNYSNSQPGGSVSQSTTLSQHDFLSRVEYIKAEIRSLSTHIDQIAALHQRSLSSPDSRASSELENLVTQTQLKNTKIRDQIKYLELDTAKTNDGSKTTKVTQSRQLKGEFERALNDYKQEELGYRQRYREQIARQYRIVNPDASEQEVKEASEADWGSEGVFETALRSNRSGQASSVLGAVRARHNELQRIEATLTELAVLFDEMAQVVEAQDPVIEHTEQNAIKTVEDMKRGNTELDKSQEHARRRRKLKWWCFLVVVLIIIAAALGIGLGIGLAGRATN